MMPIRHTVPYGKQPCQAGELYLPDAPPGGVMLICLFHGGFWLAPHDRAQCEPVALDLARRGYAVWNSGYRRIGDPDAAWPATFDDVAASLHMIGSATVAAIDRRNIVFAGHSAGGQLALWAASIRHRTGIAPRAVAGLAPVTDMQRMAFEGTARHAVVELLGGTAAECATRIDVVSPHAILPLKVRHAIIHGTCDRAIDIAASRRYAARAAAYGDRVDLVEVDGAGHMDFLDPASFAHQRFADWLATLGAPA